MAKIAESTIKRLSLYLRLLEEFAGRDMQTVSSDALAEKSGASPAQVRKDLSLFGSFGKRGLGYPVADLSGKISQILGLQRDYSVILVGAGNLGTALVEHRGFAERGFHLVAAYDSDPHRVGDLLGGLVVRCADRLDADLSAHPVDIAILTTPAGVAQAVVDRLVARGIEAILNFTAAKLAVPAGVKVRDVSMAIELESLTYAIGQEA